MSHPVSRISYTPDFVDIVATALCAFGLFFVGLAAVITLGGQPSATAMGLQISIIRVTALETLAILGAVYLMILRRHGLGMRDLGFDPLDRVWVVRAIGIGLLLIPVVGWIVSGVQTIFERQPFTFHSDMMAPRGFSWPAAGALFLYTGLLVPFAEELFFRGLLYRWLRARWDVTVATIVSSALFGLAHGHLEVIVSSFVVGIALAQIYERSRTLWAPVLLHVVFNSASLFAMFVVMSTRGT